MVELNILNYATKSDFHFEFRKLENDIWEVSNESTKENINFQLVESDEHLKNILSPSTVEINWQTPSRKIVALFRETSDEDEINEKMKELEVIINGYIKNIFQF
ncbi:MAG: hypothetical protein ACRC1R_05685 [Cetobacterium sp.]|uniref:hypothetical protein n=1 Tax=Cetobacterium sp. TaxID=2071632 RepID=UPI003F2BBD88